jgi:hypothetical protein
MTAVKVETVGNDSRGALRCAGQAILAVDNAQDGRHEIVII